MGAYICYYCNKRGHIAKVKYLILSFVRKKDKILFFNFNIAQVLKLRQGRDLFFRLLLLTHSNLTIDPSLI